MNKRDYLRTQGFNVGERGKFNDAMLTAIKNAEENGIVFSNIPQASKVEKVYKFEKIVTHLKPQVRVRQARELFGLTEMGEKVGFITCRNCQSHMIYCNCTNGVLAPKIVKSSTDPLVRVG